MKMRKGRMVMVTVEVVSSGFCGDNGRLELRRIMAHWGASGISGLAQMEEASAS